VAEPPLPIVATVAGDALQFTVAVRSCVLPSLYVPLAVNCCVVPFAIEALAGLIVIAVNTGGVTDNDAEPLIAPADALMLVAPGLRPTASPAPLTVATPTTEKVHCTALVRFWVVLLL
jgi:hypothetical protein